VNIADSSEITCKAHQKYFQQEPQVFLICADVIEVSIPAPDYEQRDLGHPLSKNRTEPDQLWLCSPAALYFSIASNT
jgi:hypothetical protein